LVGRESLFCDQVSNQDHEKVVWDCGSLLSHFFDFVFPSFLCKIGKEVLWLPGLLTSLEKLSLERERKRNKSKSEKAVMMRKNCLRVITGQ
jgi:hypothetical protein